MHAHTKKLLTEFNRYFTSSNSADVGARVSVPTKEWRELFDGLRAQAASVEPVKGAYINKRGNAVLCSVLRAQDKYEDFAEFLYAGAPPAHTQEASASLPADASPRLDWAIRVLREVCDGGREKLGDNYPILLSVLGGIQSEAQAVAANSSDSGYWCDKCDDPSPPCGPESCGSKMVGGSAPNGAMSRLRAVLGLPDVPDAAVFSTAAVRIERLEADSKRLQYLIDNSCTYLPRLGIAVQLVVVEAQAARLVKAGGDPGKGYRSYIRAQIDAQQSETKKEQQ